MFSGQGREGAQRGRTATDFLPRRENVLDARLSLAKVEERSHRLLSGGEQRVIFNIDGLCSTVRNEWDDAAKARTRQAETPASVELFMANLGFDVHEQHRLLRHIAATKPPLSSAAPPPSQTGLQQHQTQTDLEAFLASRRNEALQTAVAEVHRSMLDRERSEVDSALSSVWTSRKSELAETVGLRNLLQATTVSHGVEMHNADHPSEQYAEAPSSSAALGLAPRRCAAFARAVELFPSNAWLQKFSAIAVGDRDSPGNEALAQQWLTLEQMFGTTNTSSENQEENALRAVRSSRLVLERKFAQHMFQGSKTDLNAIDRADARVFLDQCKIFVKEGRAHSKPEPWALAFYCLRAGRADAAAIIAPEQAVKAALTNLSQGLGDTTSDSLRRELQDLYAANETSSNPHRQGTLFLLLGGRIRGSESSAQAALDRCNERLVRQIEDLLWFKLFLVRAVSRTASGASPSLSPGRAGRAPTSVLYNMHYLSTVQRGLISEQQLIFQYLDHRMEWLIDVMFHALLPATAIRLLKETGNTMLTDAVHMALALSARGVLTSFTAAEPTLELGSLLQGYITELSSTSDTTSAQNFFAYFHKSDSDSSFVELCSHNASLCSKLFGRSQSQPDALDGATKAFLDAAEKIACSCANNGNVRMAVFMYLSLHQHSTSRSVEMLQLAFAAINPELSRALHQSLVDNRRRELNDILSQALAVRRYLNETPHHLSPSDVEAFRQLSLLAEVVCASDSDSSLAISLFLQVNFVPSNSGQLDAMSRQFNTSVSGDVASVVPRVLLIVFRAIQHEYQLSTSAGDRTDLRSLAQLLLRWQSKWTMRPSSDIVLSFQRLADAVSAP